jgi:hypothetical protein
MNEVDSRDMLRAIVIQVELQRSKLENKSFKMYMNRQENSEDYKATRNQVEALDRLLFFCLPKEAQEKITRDNGSSDLRQVATESRNNVKTNIIASLEPENTLENLGKNIAALRNEEISLEENNPYSKYVSEDAKALKTHTSEGGFLNDIVKKISQWLNLSTNAENTLEEISEKKPSPKP